MGVYAARRGPVLGPAAGSPSYGSVSKEAALGPISDRALEEWPPSNMGCLHVAGPRQLIMDPPLMGAVFP